MPDTSIFTGASRFLVIGHRGAAGLAPENTLTGFAAALDLGCRAVELDVHRVRYTAGGDALCVIHDETVQRTTSGLGRVSEYSVEALRKLDAGNGARVPLLDEVFDLLAGHSATAAQRVGLNIELKGAHTARPVADFLVAHGHPGIDVMVSSFDHQALADFRQVDRATPVAALFDRWSPRWRSTAEGLDACAINLAANIATGPRVSDITAAGYGVYVYTVNTVRAAQRFQQRGCTGVFTDRPDLLLGRLPTGN